MPRQLVVTDTDSSKVGRLRVKATRPYDQDNFTPDLFAVTWGYNVYAFKNGNLYRYFRMKQPDGDLKYGKRVYVPVDARHLTSLQHLGTISVDNRADDPVVRMRGEITGAPRWDLHAVF